MNDMEAIDFIKRTGRVSSHVFKSIFAFNFQGIENLPGQIHINHCTFENGLQFLNLKSGEMKGSISFSNCIFNSGMGARFADLECEFLTFSNCRFNELTIENIKVRSVKIDNCDIAELYILSSESDSLYFFNLAEGKIEPERIAIESPSIKSVELRVNADQILLNSVNSLGLYGDFKNITIQGPFENVLIRPQYYGSFGKIHNLNFEDQVLGGQLTISDVHIEELEFSNVNTAKGSVHFNDVIISKAKFFSCSIPSFHWNLVEFKGELQIQGCNLDGLKLNNVTWLKGKVLSPDLLQLNIPWLYLIRKQWLARKKRLIDSETLKKMKYQRDVFRQLKSVSIANRNEMEALAFYKNEMRLYWKEVRITGGEKWYNTVLIFLNRFVSDFGQNWLWPLLWLLFFHTLLYLCIINFRFCGNSFESGLGQYFELLNPVHKTPDYVKGGDVVIEFLMRVADAFFIWHFLKATRRFGKG